MNRFSNYKKANRSSHGSYISAVCDKMRPVLLFSTLLVSLCCGESGGSKYVVDSLTYSAFTWIENEEFNTDELYLAFYFSIKKNGKFNAMRRDSFMGPPTYFKGIIPDSVRIKLEQLASNDYDNYYDYPGSSYNWFYYCIDYSTKGKNHNIQFIPEGAPQSLEEVSNCLDTFILNRLKRPSNSFNLEPYKNYLQTIVDSVFGPYPYKTEKLEGERARWELHKIDIQKRDSLIDKNGH